MYITEALQKAVLMDNYKDVMIDFETLGNGKDKCVCQVGAVYFDKTTGDLGKEIKLNIDAASHVRAGGKIDAETVYWWLKQSQEARDSIASSDRLPIEQAFVQLNEFLVEAKRIWSHATFDFVTLIDTMKQLNIKPSFSYKSGLDLRTLVYLAGDVSVDNTTREGIHHDGLADAKHQVKYAVKAMNRIKTSKAAISFLERLNG